MDIHELLDHMEAAVNNRDMVGASSILSAIETEFGEAAYGADHRYAILKAEYCYQNDLISDAVDTIKKGLNSFPKNYELYFIRAQYAARESDTESALASYYASLFWGLNSNDRDYLAEKMITYKKGSAVNQHRMNLALARLIQERMELEQYEEGLDFLKWLFFVLPSDSRLEYVSEETMLQFIMLEGTITEKAIFDEYTFRDINSCKWYHNSYEAFRNGYLEIKHAIRRIWFCLPPSEQLYLSDVVEKYSVSSALLAVIAKYSIPEENWVEAFERIDTFLQNNKTHLGNEFSRFAGAIGNMTQTGQIITKRDTPVKNVLTFERIYLNEGSICQDTNPCVQDPHTIAIVFCTNDELMERECLLYLSHLIVPDGMTLKVYAVWNAKGICQGYNRAMAQINAKYKIYIHHDCFLICPDALIQLMDLFQRKEGWKMLGVAGATAMTDNYCWGENNITNVRYNLYQDSCMATILSKTIRYDNKVDEAAAIDGVMLATCEDVKWREDVFDEWHFYDISQCYEFRKRGYRIGVINDDTPWMLHETTTKNDPSGRYDHYGKIFKEMYLDRAMAKPPID